MTNKADCNLRPIRRNQSELLTVTAQTRVAPPKWATTQRLLMEEIERATPLFVEAHTLEEGGLSRHGKLDDDYECFKDWPLFYAIGGSQEILTTSLRSWEAITQQWTEKGQVHREFISSGHTDMLHISEGYVGFQYFGLADPENKTNIDRACRFADFYTGEDPQAPNYDPKHRVMRSPFTGSTGPAYHSESSAFAPQDMLSPSVMWASLHPVVEDPKPDIQQPQIRELVDWLVTRSDCTMNLAVTGLVTNAYLYTGEERYKRWVLEYIGKWTEATAKNGGLVPDNLGPTGKIGEHRQGQWWGGFFGWQCMHSVEMISKALITASECACLVSGDLSHLGLLRGLIDALLERSVEQNGVLTVPHRVGPNGWYDYRPLDCSIVGHLWHNSLAVEDWSRLQRLRDGSTMDWNRIDNNTGHANEQRFNDAPHLTFLGKANPEWPIRITHAERDRVARNVGRIREGNYEMGSQTVLDQCPVLTTGLAQMTMGAPYTCFNGGLMRGHVRHFDVDLARPGLPPDIAALVTAISADSMSLHFVNLNRTESRRLVSQAGSYGEHSFTTMTISSQIDAARTVDVSGPCVGIELPPSTSIRLTLGTDRYVNNPRYDCPWQR